jgi:NAD(P)-dependent dehydrogenase (short-subunit alcohol dehydrogenase family)
LQKGKVAVITGARGPISTEIPREFAARGPTVKVSSREMAGAEKSSSLINGNVYPERLDVTVIL